MKTADEIKDGILEMVKLYYKTMNEQETKPFLEGESRINYAGRVFDQNEMINLVDSALEFWLTSGKYCRQFEKKLADFLGVKNALLVNSGSSANLLAFMALTSPLLENRAIRRGDEVITLAAGFPTTVAPIVQYGAVPVFVDITIETFNIDVSCLEKALSPKTRAVMLAHTLGNPFDVDHVVGFCKKHDLWLIEDNCDSLGSRFNGRLTGTFGDIGTSSFYPPHHITMGEGGAVYTNNPLLKKIMLSIRDWGRDCWCDSGVDNTCGKRFTQQFGKLPFGYDHKYVYSHFGYNLKATEMQASIGVAQLDKIDDFTKKRRDNFRFLYDGLNDLSDVLILPGAAENSEPSWFGFFITLRDGLRFTRNDVVQFLEGRKIQTRNLFAGNLTKHPCFDTMVPDRDFRIIGDLENTDKIMNDSFWFGVYPGMTKEKLEYIIKTIKEYVQNRLT